MASCVAIDLSFVAALTLGVCAVSGPCSLVAQAKPTSQLLPEHVYTFETEGVRLEGVLIERHVYGPPGYGETPKHDSRAIIFILRVPAAITVKATPESARVEGVPYSPYSVSHVREVQVFPEFANFWDGYRKAKKLIGHRVSAVGHLSDPVAPMEMLKVSFNIASLDPKN